ncbi:hypothetical protein Q7P37_010545 [Cladosporium fusiforme]
MFLVFFTSLGCWVEEGRASGCGKIGRTWGGFCAEAPHTRVKLCTITKRGKEKDVGRYDLVEPEAETGEMLAFAHGPRLERSSPFGDGDDDEEEEEW